MSWLSAGHRRQGRGARGLGRLEALRRQSVDILALGILALGILALVILTGDILALAILTGDILIGGISLHLVRHRRTLEGSLLVVAEKTPASPQLLAHLTKGDSRVLCLHRSAGSIAAIQMQFTFYGSLQKY